MVNGDLKNNPSISFITQSHTNVTKVNDGDLFISSSLTDIKQAIHQGAFAIIYNFEIDHENIDKEIAWIKVDNLDDALTKLLRFRLSTKVLKSYYCDFISYEILLSFKSLDKNIIFLSNNINSDFELLKELDDIHTIIATNDKFLNKIYPLSKEFIIQKYKIQNLTIHSLFETSFSYNNRYFHKLKLPQIYINNFLSINNFFDTDEYDINKLNTFKYMQPIFINKNTNIVEYGKSNKFILANINQKIIQPQIEFIYDHYKYGEIKIIDGLCFDEMLLEQIENEDYNALYIKNRKHQDIINILEQNMDNSSRLF